MKDASGELSALRAEVDQLRDRIVRLEALLSSTSPAARSSRRTATPLGLTAINRIGAVTVAIGLIFFFKYAVDEHLIGALAGVLLGSAFGFCLIAAGNWLLRRGQLVFAQGISGCGLAAVYISMYASFAFYELIPRSAGFVALVLVCACAVGLSVRFASTAISTLGIVGALLTPLLLHTRTSESWLECLYLLVVAGTATVITLRGQRPVLAAIAGALGLIAAFHLFEQRSWWFVVFGVALGIMHGLATVRAGEGSKTRNWMYIMAQIALLAAGLRTLTLSFVQSSIAYQAASIFLACWAIAELAWGLSRRSRVDVRMGLVLLALVIAKLYVWDVWSLEKVYRITAFLGLGGLLLLASWIYSRSSVSDRL